MFDFNSKIIFDDLNDCIPIFKNEIGFTMKVKIVKDNAVKVLISVSNDKDQKISLRNMNRSDIKFFIDRYRNFILSGKYKKLKSFRDRIEFTIRIIRSLLKKNQFSSFAFSTYHGLPLFLFDKFYTIDSFDGWHISETRIQNGKIENIYDMNGEMELYNIHILSLKMVYDLQINESKFSFKIIERLISHLQVIIVTLILIMDVIYTMKTFMEPDLLWSSWITFFIYGGSFILGLFSKLLPKMIIYYLINRNSLTSTINKKLANTKLN